MPSDPQSFDPSQVSFDPPKSATSQTFDPSEVSFDAPKPPKPAEPVAPGRIMDAAINFTNKPKPANDETAQRREFVTRQLTHYGPGGAPPQSPELTRTLNQQPEPSPAVWLPEFEAGGLNVPAVGLREMGQGFEHLAQSEPNEPPRMILPGSTGPIPGQESGVPPEVLVSPQRAAALSEILGGASKAALPLAGAGLVAAPVETAATLGASMLSKYGTQEGLKAAGVRPEYANLAGDVISLAVAGGGARYILGKADAALAEHNTVAERLLDQERTGGRQTETLNDIFAGDRHPVIVHGQEGTLEYIGSGKTETGRPLGVWRVSDAEGKPIYQDTTQGMTAWLQQHGVTAKPTGGTSMDAIAGHLDQQYSELIQDRAEAQSYADKARKAGKRDLYAEAVVQDADARLSDLQKVRAQTGARGTQLPLAQRPPAPQSFDPKAVSFEPPAAAPPAPEPPTPTSPAEASTPAVEGGTEVSKGQSFTQGGTTYRVSSVSAKGNVLFTEDSGQGTVYRSLPLPEFRALALPSPVPETSGDQPGAPPTPAANTPPAASAPPAEPSEQKIERASTQANLPADIAGDVRNFGASIPEDQLAKNGREPQPHATVLYGLHDDEPEPVRRLLALEGPITATLGKASVFHTPDADVLKVDVDSPDLHRLNAKFRESLPYTNKFPDYKPHVTVAYLKPGQGAQYEGQGIPNVTGKQVTLNSIAFSDKAEKQTEIPLRSLDIKFPLSGDAGEVQKRSIEELKADPQGLVDRYRKENGNEFAPDNAAELFGDYSASPESRGKYRTAVSAAAGWVADEAFRQRLAESDDAPVVFMAGGTGSGKSTGAAHLSGEGKHTIVFDATFSDYNNSKNRVEEALRSGRQVLVAYVYRDPVEAWDAAKERTKKEGAGRVVSLASHVFTHTNSPQVVRRMAEEYKGDSQIHFRYLENRTGQNLREGGIELTEKGDYDSLRERLERHEQTRNENNAPGVVGPSGPVDAGERETVRGESGSADQGTPAPGLQQESGSNAEDEVVPPQPVTTEDRALVDKLSKGDGLGFVKTKAKPGQYSFADSAGKGRDNKPFMTALAKSKALIQWRTFLQNGLKAFNFNDPIYKQLTQHGGFMAHMGRGVAKGKPALDGGFYTDYFLSGDTIQEFLKQFDARNTGGRNKLDTKGPNGTESGNTYWLNDETAGDLNRAMVAEATPYVEELIDRAQKAQRAADLIEAERLAARHGTKTPQGEPKKAIDEPTITELINVSGADRAEIEKAAQSLVDRGQASRGDVHVKIVPHPAAPGQVDLDEPHFAVEVTRNGDRSILNESPILIENARRGALRQLFPAPAAQPDLIESPDEKSLREIKARFPEGLQVEFMHNGKITKGTVERIESHGSFSGLGNMVRVRFGARGGGEIFPHQLKVLKNAENDELLAKAKAAADREVAGKLLQQVQRAALANAKTPEEYIQALPEKYRAYAQRYLEHLRTGSEEPPLSLISKDWNSSPWSREAASAEGISSRLKEFVKDETEVAPPAEPAERTGAAGLVDAVYRKLSARESLGNQPEFYALAEKYFGSPRTSGQWDTKDAMDAMEAGVNRYLVDHGARLYQEDAIDALKELRGLMALLPTQGTRTEEQLKAQQFSTPPTESFVAAKAANLRPTDVVLEPSAGNGGLAAWPKAIGAAVHVNEISDRRAQMLEEAGFGKPTAHDGELINALLDRSIVPTVVLMNPPFSSGALKSHATKNRNQYGFNHVDQALQRLAPGGRLVAILGGGRADDVNGGASFTGGSTGQWFDRVRKIYDIKANVRIHGKEYQKYGTAFATRIIVIDKTGPTQNWQEALLGKGSIVQGNVDTLEEAYNLLRDVAEQRPAPQLPAGTGSPAGIGESNPDAGVGTRPGTGGARGGKRVSGGRGSRGSRKPADRPAGTSGSTGGLQPGESDQPAGLREPTDRPAGSNGHAGAGGSESGAESDEQRPVSGDRKPGEDLAAAGGLSADDIQDIINAGIQSLTQQREPAPTPAPTATTTPAPAPRPRPARPPKKAAAKPAPTPAPSPAPATKPSIKDAAQQARDRLRERLNKPSSTQARKRIDPAEFKQNLIDLATIGAEHLIAGAKAMPEWSQKIWDDVGDLISTVADQANMKPEDVLRQVHQLAQAIAVNFEPLTGEENTEGIVKIERADRPVSEKVDTDAYVAYHPTIKGGTHPGDIVETKTMATVPLPPITYQPRLPASVMKGGISAVQLEGVAIAGQQNDILLPGGLRGAALIGDGTGVGKGREAAGYLWDNFRHGRKRLVWISEKWDLMQDACRDLTGLGAGEMLQGVERQPNGKFVITPKAMMQPFNRWNYGAKISHEGVIFSTYGTVRGKDKKGNRRVAQLEEYLRGDDDGEGAAIVFDEAHNLKNAVPARGIPASQIGQAVKELLEHIPNLRTLSLSATAATDVSNLGYLDRLGLWGPGTPFPTGFQQFQNQIARGGLSAMEMIARELKAQGKYVSRTLSFHGVEYQEHEHALTPEQKELYRAAGRAWGLVLDNASSTIANVTNGGRQQRSNFLSQFYGAQQRFFNVLITTLKIPTAVGLANQALADGKAVVITLVNTNEAAQNREKAKARDEDDEDEVAEFDFGPAEMLVDLIRKHYPVQQYADDVNDNGDPIKVPVYRRDENGREIPVTNPDAEAERDALIEEIKATLHMPDNPLDILIQALGGESKVAELTGRKERFDRNTEKFVPRGDKGAPQKDINLNEMRHFQSGKKLVAILSGAAGTGISLHAGNDVANQRQRYHITLQVGWSADKAMQMFGRTHRTNQKQPPQYVMLVSDLGGERRFVSTISRRLGSLGALTKGQKNATGGTDLMEKVNFETDQGRAATNTFYERLLRDIPVPGAYEAVPAEDENGVARPGQPEVQRQMTGLQILSDLHVLINSPSGPTVPAADRTNVTRLLNRLLALDPDIQNAVYNYFYDIFQAVVQAAVDAGTLDTGVKTLPGDIFHLKEERVISTDPKTGAETFYYPVEVKTRTNRISPEELDKRLVMHADKNPTFVVNDKGKIALLIDAPPRVRETGAVEPAFYRTRPDDGEFRKITRSEMPHTIRTVEESARERLTKAESVQRSEQRSVEYWQEAGNQSGSGSDSWYYRNNKEVAQQHLARAQEKLNAANEELAQAQAFAANPIGWAKEQWAEQFRDAPSHRTTEHHFIGGAVLKFWNPITDAIGRPNIYTAVDSETGKRVVGLDIPAEHIKRLVDRISGSASTVNASQLVIDVLRNNLTYTLEGGIQVRQGRVGRDPVIQLIPPTPDIGTHLRGLGVRYEKGVFPIYYLPNGEKGEPHQRQSVVAGRVLEHYPVQPDAPATLQSRALPGFFSQLQRAIEEKMPAKATISQVIAIVRNPQNGVKVDEVKWSGLENWLGEQTGPVSKDAVMDFLRQNEVRVEEVEKATAPRYPEYSFPAAQHYRELLLTLPAAHPRYQSPGYQSPHWDENNVLAHIRVDDQTGSNGEKILHVEEIQSDWHQEGRTKGYRPSGVERETLLSKIEELDAAHSKINEQRHAALEQMKWGAEENGFRPPAPGTAGFKKAASEITELDRDAKTLWDKIQGLRKQLTAGVPNAPFSKDWHQLAFKRVLRYAAEHDYQKVTWITGEQQAERFDLAQHIDSIDYKIHPDGAIDIVANPKAGQEGDAISKNRQTPEELEHIVGKEIAKRILEDKDATVRPDKAGGQWKFGTLEGVDLKVGGEGMKGFYDKILPDYARRYAKKWEAAVGPAEIESGKGIAVLEPGENAPDGAVFVIRPNENRTDWTVQQILDSGRGHWVGSFSSENSAQEYAETALSEVEPRLATVHSIDITPAMRESVMKGQPLFNRPFDPSKMSAAAVTPEQKKRGYVQAWTSDADSQVGIAKLADGSYRVLGYHGSTDGPFHSLEAARERMRELVHLPFRAETPAPAKAPSLADAPRPFGRWPSIDQVDRYWQGAQAQGAKVEGVPVLWVNNAALELFGNNSGTFNGGLNPEQTLGTVLDAPARRKLFDAARRARDFATTEPVDAALIRVADALEQIAPAGTTEPVVIVQAGNSQPRASVSRVLREELNHVKQRQLPSGLRGLPVAPLETPLGRRAENSLVWHFGYKRPQQSSPHYEHDRAIMSAEVAVRLMDPALYPELGLSPDEAVELAGMYRDQLLEAHGDRAAEVTDRITRTVEELHRVTNHARADESQPGPVAGVPGAQSARRETGGGPMAEEPTGTSTAEPAHVESRIGQPAAGQPAGANRTPRLNQFAAALTGIFGPNTPRANYTGLGAPKDLRSFFGMLRDKKLRAETKWVRGGAQTAAASPSVDTALRLAATPKSQVAVMIATAHPAMAKVLKRSGLRVSDFYRWGQQDRLYGIRKRWDDFAAQPSQMDDESLKQAMTDDAFLGLLSKVEGKKNLADNQADTAEAILEEGDLPLLRDFLETAFRDASEAVTDLMSHDEYARLAADPNMQDALGIYKQRIEAPIAQDHAINDGIFSTALGPTNTYFPLIPMTDEGVGTKPGYSAAYPYKKPRNIANRFATGLSEDYSSDAAAMRDRFIMGVRANTKANFIQSALDANLMKVVGPGTDRDVYVWRGQEYKASRPYVVSDSRTIIQNGKVIHVRPRIVVMPEWFHREIAPVLEGEKWDSDDVSMLARVMLGFTLSGPAEAAFHWANVTGAIVANTPYLQRSLMGKAASIPLVKRFAAIGYVLSVDPSTEEAAAELMEMAKVGAVPSRYGSETYSKRFAEELGAKRRRLSLAPSLFGPHGFDIRARLLMWRLAKAINPAATPRELAIFVNQLGNYVPQLQGEMERAFKRSGVATFYTAGSTMIRNGVNALTGGSPTAGGKGKGLIAWKLLTGGLGMVALWTAIHHAVTGKYPWEDKRAKFLSVPAPASFRYSPFGRAVWGNGPEVGYIGLSFFNPITARGSRAVGVPAAFETAMRGGTPGQAFEHAQMQIFNSLIHPVEGPLLRTMMVGVLGSEGQLSDLRDRSGAWSPRLWSVVPPGSAPGLPTLGRKGLALLSLNSFWENVGEGTGLLATHKKGSLVLNSAIGMIAPGLFTASNPYAQGNILRQQQVGEKRAEARRRAEELLPR